MDSQILQEWKARAARFQTEGAALFAGASKTGLRESIRTESRPEGQRPVVFIGHGRSPVWRVLKDLLHDRLGLDWTEFNHESAAGIPTANRLEAMMESADFAFLVMTAEDVHADGSRHARENVIHEAGLFQGKLGFRRSIILLEEGCAEFSNVIGLGQIRFPVNDIMARSEQIREVLEREGVIATP